MTLEATDGALSSEHRYEMNKVLGEAKKGQGEHGDKVA